MRKILNKDDIVEILKLWYIQKASQKEISEKFKVSQSHISHIVNFDFGNKFKPRRTTTEAYKEFQENFKYY